MQKYDETQSTGCMLVIAHYLDHWMVLLGYSTCCSDLVGNVPRLLIEP